MAIDKRTATFYRVICNRCGRVAPESLSQDEALILAQAEGWQHFGRARWVDLEKGMDLCPSCFEQWELERSQRLELAKAEQPAGQEAG